MTRRFFGFLGALAGVALVGGSCVEDPLSNLDGTPAALIVSHSALQITQGSSIVVTASVVDGRSTPLAVPVTFSACDGAVAVAPDTPAPVPATAAREVVSGVSLAVSCINVAGAGFTKQIPVVVLPGSFAGAVSTQTPLGGDTMTLASTALLKFDTSIVSLAFGAVTATILAKTPDLLTFLVPFSQPGPITVRGVSITYVAGLRDTLPTSAIVTQTGDQWLGDTTYATAPIIATPATAGTSLRYLTHFGPSNNTNCAEFGPPPPNGSTGPCVIYRFDLAVATQLRFTTDWDGTGDVDTYVCDDSGLPGCFESGGSGAFTSHPEVITAFNYPAGTHYFVVELFGGGGPTNLYITVTRP